ncbi:helix-turn-helix domain-containing protein [Actinomadura parmotrematis]|uniref:Helix-turn-helix transcriptional regulator n=1 Tax=Actinomadura parmotrematis TaxID=2864039 RepID=A0ABS7FW28_9ACTN|nr:helix-turn-helix transcriptional regulator [Actinomadura parmotrematis]MBW8484375.1 helix-turn-helix transcriptional regulator [Actinomadura parmotrematis]
MESQPLTPSAGPRHLFGSEVRYHRELRGHSLRALAALIPFGASTISEIERGLAACDLVFAELADGALETGGALARLHGGLFDGRAAAFPDHFVGWPEQESEAELLRSYQPLLVDGLLQTPDYARELLYGDEKAVEARMARQAILSRDEPLPPRLMVLMAEHVLWHRIGTAALMYEQLHHIADVISPRLSVQILPDGCGHSGHLGGFAIARLCDGHSVAYVDHEPAGVILGGRREVERLSERFSDLATYALPADMSGALIRETAESRWKT